MHFAMNRDALVVSNVLPCFMCKDDTSIFWDPNTHLRGWGAWIQEPQSFACYERTLPGVRGPQSILLRIWGDAKPECLF